MRILTIAVFQEMLDAAYVKYESNGEVLVQWRVILIDSIYLSLVSVDMIYYCLRSRPIYLN